MCHRNCFSLESLLASRGTPVQNLLCFPIAACGRHLLGEHIHPLNLSPADLLIQSLDTVEHLLITRRAAGREVRWGALSPDLCFLCRRAVPAVFPDSE